MKPFRQFFTEGGNVKVNDLHAEPISVTEKNRASVQHDVHGALSALHNSFYKQYQQHLFGKGKVALHTGSAYSGSANSLMSPKISHKEFSKHKSSVGDIDTMIPKEHAENLYKHLQVGKKFGHYEVAGLHRHGTETSALMKHSSGKIHQFDFEHVDYDKNEPSKGDQFLHSSNWSDTKKGIKGIHHKWLLHSVASGIDHKVSITNGLRSKTDIKDSGIKDPEQMTKKLFGDKADHSKIHSFQGVTELIKKHLSKEQQQGIYNKFKSMTDEHKKVGVDHMAAMKHLESHLL